MSANSGGLGSSFEKLRQELDSLLESAWSNGEKALDRMGMRPSPPGFEPAVEVIETAESIIVIADIPGIEPSGVEVQLVGNVVTLQGARIATVVGEGDKRHLAERRCGKFAKAVSLPVPVDPDSVSADVRHGILTVRLGKLHILKPRQIPVNIG
ncbi:MAG: heat shock protein Hsp20 [Planctomycetaceae bacterium]|nr:heat shock protein Hsp20 [Planctomycetaceae bacterium]